MYLASDTARQLASGEPRLRHLIAALERFDEGAPPVGELVTSHLRELCDMDVSAHYHLEMGAGHFELRDFRSAVGRGFDAARMNQKCRGYLAKATLDKVVFAQPPRAERNRALVLKQLAVRRETTRIHRELLVPLGLGQHDQLRATICDGARLLAWVGGFRIEPFTPHHQANMDAVIPALQRRLVREDTLNDAGLARCGLEVAMESLPTPALFVDQRGRIVHRNSAATESWLAHPSRFGFLADLGRKPAPPDFDVVALGSKGQSQHWFVTQRSTGGETSRRLEAFCKSQRLTRRQCEVLRLLVMGQSNKAIAQHLGCALRTVELHVSNLLAKTGCETRTEVVSRALNAIG